MSGNGKGRNYSAMKWLQEKIEERRALLPNRVDSKAQWEVLRRRIRDYLRDDLALGCWAAPGRSYVVGASALEDDLVLEWIDVNIEDDYFMKAHLYRRKELEEPAPAIVVSHGYAQSKRDPILSRACMELARHGYVVMAVEHAPSGEAADRPDYETNISNITAAGMVLGVSNPALWALDNIRSVDYLQTRDDVDGQRLGIVGLCQGSIGLWPAAAYDERFRVCIPFYGGTTYSSIGLEYMSGTGGWTGGSPYMFGILNVCDVQHLLACVAPRPLLVINNVCDIHWPLGGLQDIADFCGQVYELHGAGEHFAIQLESGEHNFVEKPLQRICGWFDRWL